MVVKTTIERVRVLELSEKAKSRAQQRFFGMVRATQKGEMDSPSSEVAQAAASISTTDVKKFAKTKHKGLPEKKKVEEGSLHKWFKGSKSKDGKGGWVNVVTGGTCASDEPGEGTPKCVSASKRASMTKAERDSASRRKKAADPGQQQKTGAAKPTYVSTDKKKMKEETQVDEACWKGYEKKGMKTMFGKRYPNCVKKKATRSEATDAQLKSQEKAVFELEKKHGKGANYDGKSKSKSPSPAEKAKASAERKKRQDADNKAYAARAKKAGFKSTQDYTNVVARYGSEDNYRKGKGLGT